MIKEIENTFVNQYKAKIVNTCIKHDVNTLYLFGSHATNKNKSNSDVDLLVRFNEDLKGNYFDNYFDFQFELEDITGKKIDIITENTLKNKYLIDSINKSKILVYAK